MKMLIERVDVKKEFFTKIAPGMWQYLSSFIAWRISVFYMISQLLHMVYPLLSDENSATLQTHKAKSLLMDSLHMAPQALLIRKMLLVIAAAYQTVQVSKLHSLTLGGTIIVKD